ncbi:hypothetical protein [Mycobacterium sp. HNNTM2301]|uniref:hypothetical protein n=1 Tax=Mycobacterium hainanense TaxID=3289775 RepID=UPI0035A69258
MTSTIVSILANRGQITRMQIGGDKNLKRVREMYAPHRVTVSALIDNFLVRRTAFGPDRIAFLTILMADWAFANDAKSAMLCEWRA